MMKRVVTGIAQVVRTDSTAIANATPSAGSSSGTRSAAASRLSRRPTNAAITSAKGQAPQGTAARQLTAQQRGIVTQATQQVLDTMPITAAVAERVKFQAYGRCEENMKDLQRKVLAAMSDGRTDHALTIKTDPSAGDIERAVQDHGPVRLTLQGLLPDEQGGALYPHYHAVLVTGVVRDPKSGLRIAVLADGNDLARDPLKAIAEAHAEAQGKTLAQLDADDFRAIDARIAQAKPGDDLKRSFFRLVDLDQAVASHHTTQENLLSRHEQMRRELPQDGPDLPPRSKTPGEMVFAVDAQIDGRMKPETEQALLDLVRRNPGLVERPSDWAADTLQAGASLGGSTAIPPSHDVLAMSPALMKVFKAPSTAAPWKPLAHVDELRAELAKEPTIAPHLDTPEGRAWCKSLFDEVNARSHAMGEKDKGIEMIARFKSTYSTNHHVAIGAMWRDDAGKLRMGLVHQESVPVDKKNWQGHVYRTFDTADKYPGGYAPVVESMKLAGLPDLKLLGCSQPDKIVATGKAMEGLQNAAPYGAHQNWADGDKGRFSSDKNFMTCFNVTREVHDMINGVRPRYRPSLPQLFNEMSSLTNSDPKNFEMLKVGNAQYKHEEIKNLPADISAGMFLEVGRRWGQDGTWDVQSPRTTAICQMKLPAGRELPLPQDALPVGALGAKFLNPRGLVTGDGTSVKREIVYPRDEIVRMRYSGEKPASIRFVASMPKEGRAEAPRITSAP